MPSPQTLVRDDRAFDAAMVGSALRFLSRFQGPPDDAAATAAVAPFAWVPKIAQARAARAGFDLEPWTLPLPLPARIPATDPQGKRVLVYPAHDDTLANHCHTLATRFWLGVLGIKDGRGRDPEIEQWLVKQLQALHFDTRYRYRSGRAQLVSVPVPRSVEACLVYALAVLAEDEWRFRDRVGQCPYERKHDSRSHFEPRHWFFDVDGRGRLPISAPLKFCCADHANAYRQREWRKGPTVAKHK
jgi:hypothetical protein